MLNYTLRVHSLIIPIESGNLLLPNANVAEVVKFKKPESLRGAPDWLLGFVPWRDIKVPLIAFESILGKDRPSMDSAGWMLILNTLGGHNDIPFFAILVQGKPKLMQVDESIVTPMTAKDQKGVLRHVHVHGEPAVIPDPDYIESLLRQFKESVRSNQA